MVWLPYCDVEDYGKSPHYLIFLVKSSMVGHDDRQSSTRSGHLKKKKKKKAAELFTKKVCHPQNFPLCITWMPNENIKKISNYDWNENKR